MKEKYFIVSEDEQGKNPYVISTYSSTPDFEIAGPFNSIFAAQNKLKKLTKNKKQWGGTAESSETGVFIGGENASSMYNTGGGVGKIIFSDNTSKDVAKNAQEKFGSMLEIGMSFNTVKTPKGRNRLAIKQGNKVLYEFSPGLKDGISQKIELTPERVQNALNYIKQYVIKKIGGGVEGGIVTYNNKKYKKLSNGKWQEIGSDGLTRKEHELKAREHGNALSSSKTKNLKFHFEEEKKHIIAMNKLDGKQYTDEQIGLNKMATGGAMNETFPETDAMSYAGGGGVSNSDFERDYKKVKQHIKEGYGNIDSGYVESTWENMSNITYSAIEDKLIKRLKKDGLFNYAKGGGVGKMAMSYKLNNKDKHNIDIIYFTNKDKMSIGELKQHISDKLKINYFEISSYMNRNGMMEKGGLTSGWCYSIGGL